MEDNKRAVCPGKERPEIAIRAVVPYFWFMGQARSDGLPPLATRQKDYSEDLNVFAAVGFRRLDDHQEHLLEGCWVCQFTRKD
jgi:hypothetical protein